MTEERIEPSFSGFAAEIGWTPDLFDGYLYKYDKTIWIQVIRSKKPHQGNFKKFYNDLIAKYQFRVKIVSPFVDMEKICIRWHLEPSVEKHLDNEVIIWTGWPL